MTKKPDYRFVYIIPVLIGITVVACVALLMFQMFAFTHSYLREEQFELREKVEDFIHDNYNLITHRKYSEVDKSLKNLSIRISIFDENKKLLASNIDKNDKYVEVEPFRDDIIYHINAVNAKRVKESGSVTIASRVYYLKTYMPIDEMADLLNRSERNILITFLTGSLIVIILSLYLFYQVRNPFINLQQSAVKISNGDFSNEIFVPNGGPLVQLSLAIYKMAKKLKSQIEDLRKTEDFRKSFIEDISHEIKTPLTGILSSIGIMREFKDKYPEQVNKCVNILDNNANRLNNLVQQILSLAQIEDLSMLENKNFIKFDLKTTLENSVISCNSMLQNANMKVNLDIAEPVEIMGDIVLIEQAITNLIVNAVKYSKSSQIDIKMSHVGDMAVIVIKDYGVGISPNDVDHIFDRFYRVDKARSRELGGSGLGLAIVKNIVLLHNGTIELDSSVNKGCTFTLTLPTADFNYN